MATGIRKGDVVKFKPEWQDPRDDELTFVAAADQSPDGSVLVFCTAHADWPIVPTQRVEADMIADPKWVIEAAPFGTPWYATGSMDRGREWTDRRDEAAVFDHRDSQETKLKYFSALLRLLGLSSDGIRVVHL